MAAKLVVASVLLSLASLANSQALGSIPGAQTASGVIASTLDGASRYFAPDGPIQPAITAIGGAPMRGAEMLNGGITYISSGLRNGAQASSRAAGGDPENIRMPGMEALESSMPASFAQLGSAIHSGIRAKNNFIRGQAERGVQAGERLRKAMEQGLSVKSSQGPMVRAGGMMEQSSDAMMKGASQIQDQLKQSMSGVLNRIGSLQNMGTQMRGQMDGMGKTLQQGLESGLKNGQNMSQKLRSQLESALKSNMNSMSGIMNSMQGSMGQLGQNAQKNIRGMIENAQKSAQQLSGHLQNAVSAPMDMMKNMMNGASSSGNKY